MNFNNLSWAPFVLGIFALFALLLIVLEQRFFKFVKTYWFYRRSFLSYISSILFLAGMGGLLLSLLDLRGKEQKIKTPIPTDRTIILLDTSASMLAEDVKPSRLQKAVLIAKHFARKAAGHQISIVAFAEIQKKIVPFTNDLDLIDSRLESLKTLRNHYGSSALSLAIQESVQYFRDNGGENQGNILVLTDGEETAEGIDLKIPEKVNLALVGIGTSQGSKIPLDDGRGFRFGYKKEKGKDIITKLKESFFSDLTSQVSSSKYWIASTYSLPSEEILEFFQGGKIKSDQEQDMVVKPVLMEWIVVPSLILLFLSYLLKSIRILTLSLLLFVPLVNAEEKQVEIPHEVVTKLDEFRAGKLNRLEKIKLADDLQKVGAKEEALTIYQESLPTDIDNSIPPEAYLNYGTTLLEKGDSEKGLNVYKKLLEKYDGEKEFKSLSEIMNKNVLTYFQKKSEQEKKQDEQNKDKQQNKDDQNQSGSGQKSNSNNGKSEQNKNKNQNDDQEYDKDKKKADRKDQKKDDQKNESQDENQDDQESGQDEKKKPLPPKKLPAKLKQLMSDDRQLQMKMIENGTRDLNKRKSRKSKDW